MGVNGSLLRHLVIMFRDPAGSPVILATSLKLADRSLFSVDQQHLYIPALFWTTPNAVFSQLYLALLVYVLLKSSYDEIYPGVPPSATCHLPLLLACLV
ncbi:hypothetical protein KP014_02475 [Paenibacillus sophorae]|uniref:Uncharacterized protein n=1 Tax=Paenibacillus sophorae TaxID=1333845 RepID=A0ABX8HHB5_9BACL|nr:hypothetical protein [Paenibacillus sophorae]QWU16160.1 hypothetical protein KP014_02475 [Paenibacillus sophorae]